LLRRGQRQRPPGRRPRGGGGGGDWGRGGGGGPKNHPRVRPRGAPPLIRGRGITTPPGGGWARPCGGAGPAGPHSSSPPRRPPAAVPVQAGGQSYEYLNGIFYQAVPTPSGQSYQVVQAPNGATVFSVPQGAQRKLVNGSAYYSYGSTWFQAFYSGNQTIYQVV